MLWACHEILDIDILFGHAKGKSSLFSITSTGNAPTQRTAMMGTFAANAMSIKVPLICRTGGLQDRERVPSTCTKTDFPPASSRAGSPRIAGRDCLSSRSKKAIIRPERLHRRDVQSLLARPHDDIRPLFMGLQRDLVQRQRLIHDTRMDFHQ
ncbi:MAG: hypothetical protein GY868_09935, partial [Deltaproteobacteria bacterium]|nr:hypothetical protein [Deltaproteobacteria bacterium]